MKKEIKKVQKNKHKINHGGFYLKVGLQIIGNTIKVTKGGKITLDLLKKEKMELINTVDKYNG